MRLLSICTLLWACNTSKDLTEDADKDGFTPETGDCNDEDDSIGPAAPDTVGDGIDNNCDGLDGVDGDLDGYASVASGGDDCDDLNAEIHVDAQEVCDSLDNDCDDLFDEADDSLDTSTALFLYMDNDRDGYGDENETFYSCEETDAGVTVVGDCDDTTADLSPAVPEVCDGIDNNCNGEIDDGVLSTFYADTDFDGFGDVSNTVEACEQEQPTGYVTDSSDCDDAQATVYPGALEICDGLDNSCNSLIDEADPMVDLSTGLALYTDNDNDGFGVEGSLFYACEQPWGASTNDLDCNDNDPNTYVGAAEFEDLTLCMTDADGDGYGDMNAQEPAVDGTDCDDQAFTIYPGAPDSSVDGFDQNCDLIDGQDADWDGQAAASAGGTDCDDADPNTYLGAAYLEAPTLCMTDVDGDGYGDANPSNTAVSAGTDCDDNDSSRSPGELEVCDGIDNDCDQSIDDGLTFADYYIDTDGDGYGESSTLINTCAQLSGMVEQDGDCDESDPLIYPGALEIDNDGVDQDCDGFDNYVPDMMSDFYLEDVNPYSATYGQFYSPRDYLQQVSGWYFIHAT